MIGAAALGAGMLGGCAPKSKEDMQTASAATMSGGVDPASIDWKYEADVVVVGSGSSGTCAAIEAAEAGSSVLILEKNNAMYGGNSALCGGYMLAAGWSTQEELTGVADDTPEAFAEQMVRWAQGSGNVDMIREAALRSGEAVDWMISTGRVYKGASIIPPIWAMGDTEKDIVPRSIYNHEAYGATEGHMATLRARVDSLDNIEIQMGAEVAHIVKGANGEVVGVQLADGSYAKARKGVVLACASVDNNTQMAKDLGLLQQVWGMTLDEAGYFNPGNPDTETNTGDGVRMLREIGADLCLGQACCMNDEMYIGGISDWGMSEAMGKEENIYGSTNLDGIILVNNKGKRFCQDDAEWGYVIAESAKQAWANGFNPDNPESGFVWYIAGSESWAFEARGWTDESNGVSHSSDTIEGLAEYIGCEPQTLVDEVERWNAFVDAGVDRDFGRKANLGVKIATPPFYCAAMKPGPMGTFAGAKTNIETEVLGLDGEAIPRLYAAGAIAGGNWAGEFYFGCGWAITNTVVWGREAGQNVAALDPWE